MVLPIYKQEKKESFSVLLIVISVFIVWATSVLQTNQSSLIEIWYTLCK